MAKMAIDSVVKMYIKAGEATPAPPVGSILGAKGVKIMDFCKSFNERTKLIEKGTPLPVKIMIRKGSFDFIVRQPTASYLLLRAASVTSGSSAPNKNRIGKLTRKQIETIAVKKMEDLNAISLEGAIRTLSGTARSMGLEVEGV